jgi:hypothetical protein
VRTAAKSAPYSWHYLRWWRVTMYALARALAPPFLRSALRAMRTAIQSRRRGKRQ